MEKLRGKKDKKRKRRAEPEVEDKIIKIAFNRVDRRVIVFQTEKEKNKKHKKKRKQK